MANAEETHNMLSMFNDEFDTSKQEQINRFLTDQQVLNKRFEDYELQSDTDDEASESAKNLQKKYSIGISPEELHRNLNGNRDRDDDRESLDSVLTACANSDSDDDVQKTAGGKKSAIHKKLPLSAPRFEAPEPRKPSRIGRSQSLRVANKMDLSILKHAPQPPNSPEPRDVDGEDKPSLDGIKISRRSSLRENKRKPPRKLLLKRSERPKSALGYQTALSLVDEDGLQEDGFVRPDRLQVEAQCRPAMAAAASRSAPLYKNRVLNWDTDCPKSSQADTIPNLSTPLDVNRTRAPTYAPAPLPSHTRPHPPPSPSLQPKVPPVGISRNKSIRKSITKRHSESNMGGMALSSNKETLKPMNRLNPLSVPIQDLDEIAKPSPSEPATGRMRRFKGHSNLNDSPLTPRGTALAVLKLPPVTGKNKSYSNSEKSVRPGTSLSFFNTSETLV